VIPDICRHFFEGTEFRRISTESDLSECSLEEVVSLLSEWYREENPKADSVPLGNARLLCSSRDADVCASLLECELGKSFGGVETYAGVPECSWAVSLGNLVVLGSWS
jgi:hypothetical protein